MKDNDRSIIVAHPAQQHSYRLASAIKDIHMLHSYCTTIYYNEDKVLYKLLSKVLSSDNIRRMKNRRILHIEDNLVQFNEYIGLMYLLIVRLDKRGNLTNRLGNYMSSKFGKNIANYAKKNKVNMVVAYDKFAYECFYQLKNTNIIKVLDMSSIPNIEIFNIIQKDIEYSGIFKQTYEQQLMGFDKKTLDYSLEEIRLADYFLVPSKFVKDTLIKYNIEEKRIKVARYGSDISTFAPKVEYKTDDKLVFLFVGRLTAAKGIHYLLEAFKQLNRKDIELRVVGSKMNNDEIFEAYRDYFSYLGMKNSDEMPEVYRESDVFVLPTMYEGASLSIIEALASGVPVISTNSSGNGELITNEKEGFVIEAGNVEALKEKILWFIDNKHNIPEMGKNARKLAELNTWDIYDKNIEKAVCEVLLENG